MKFAYNADRAGAYVAPVSTVLAQYEVAEGDDLFPVIMAHLRRLYTEVYVPEMATGWAPERRDFQIGEGEGLSGRTSMHSSIKLGGYVGRLTNLNLEGMNKPSPNLTTVYLNTPLVGLTRDPLEYAPSPGRLGNPSGYPPTSTGGGPYTGSFRRKSLYSTPTVHNSLMDATPHWSGATMHRSCHRMVRDGTI